MKRIIFDFDNTMGVKGCDVDDGLALLYLLGNPELCRIEAVCTTYGNSTTDIVHENTLRMLREWQLDIPAYRGGSSPNDLDNEASRYLAQAAAKNPGELSILATGSLTNLRGAAKIDPHFFENVEQIVLMGGITQSLIANGHFIHELNFSCDPQAALDVIGSDAQVSIATSHNCLPATFSRETFERALSKDASITRAIDYWYADMDERHGWELFTAWDLVSAAMLIKPELFDDATMNVTLNERMLGIGYLEHAAHDAPQAVVHTPTILDATAFIDDALASWARVSRLLGLEV